MWQNGRTPLMSAAFGGHENVVRLLVEARAAVNAADMVHGVLLYCDCKVSAWLESEL